MKIELELVGFTPVLDNLTQEYNLVTAAIYGIVWRYAQMNDKVCKASLEKIGKRLDLSGKTAERHIRRLCTDGYLVDLTPDVRNKPHSYAVTGKAEMGGSIVARSDRESHQGQTESRTKVRQRVAPGQTESPLKIHDKKQKTLSAIADYRCPISLLTEKEVKLLKLTLTDWKQYLQDEQAERNRKGIIGFIEKKLLVGPLLPDTPDSQLLFSKLEREAEARGRNPPVKFPSLACKEKFDLAAAKLNGTLEPAIDTALQNGIIAIPKIVSYIASPKWQEKPKNEQAGIREGKSGSIGQTGRYQDPLIGSGQSPQQREKLKLAFSRPAAAP